MPNQFLENIPGTRTQSLFEAAEGEDLDTEFTGATPGPMTQPTPTPTQTPTWTPTPTPSPQTRGSQDELVTGESLGDPQPASVTVDEGALDEDQEIGNATGIEAGEDYIEATPEQLTERVGAETAVSDLQGIEGFELESVYEAATEFDVEPLPEVGEALEGGAETVQAELGFLASLIPTLVTTVGPPLAKAVARKLRPRTRRKIARVAKAAKAVAPTVVSAIRKTSSRGSIVSLLSKLLVSAESMPTQEAAPPVDEALANQVAAAIEVIIGRDERVRIKATSNTNWRRIVALRIEFPSGRTYRGTGFMISNRAVATAGHCVFLKSEGGWARRIEVIPGADGSSRPYGSVQSTAFRSVAGWVRNQKPEYDYGCIVIPSGAFGVRNLGHFGFAALDPATMRAVPAVLAGYPGDKPFAELWGMANRIKTISARLLVYDTDTMGGQSGAPVYVKRNGQRIVVGIHRGGHQSGNSAARITPSVYRRLADWAKIS